MEESRAEEQSADPLGTSSRTRRGNNGGTDRGVRVGNATKPCKITRVGEGRRGEETWRRKGREREREKERGEKRRKEKKSWKRGCRRCWRGQLAVGMWVRLPIGGPL